MNSSSTRDAQIVVWALSDITDGTTDLGAGFELELNGWCSPSGSSTTTPTLNWDGTTYSGGCSSVTNDLLFNSTGGLVGYVDDSSEPDCNFSNACTVTFASTLPTDWTKGSTVTSVPEPGALTLLAIALAMYLLTSRRLVRRSPPRHRGIARCS